MLYFMLYMFCDQGLKYRFQSKKGSHLEPYAQSEKGIYTTFQSEKGIYTYY